MAYGVGLLEIRQNTVRPHQARMSADVSCPASPAMTAGKMIYVLHGGGYGWSTRIISKAEWDLLCDRRPPEIE